MTSEQTQPSENQRYIDFDAMQAERAAKPVKIKVYQQEWDMPAKLPAETVLLIMRVKQTVGLENMSPENVLAIGDSLIPADTKRAWFDKGMDVEFFAQIVGRLIREYNEEMNYRPQTSKKQGGGAAKNPKKG